MKQFNKISDEELAAYLEGMLFQIKNRQWSMRLWMLTRLRY